ncbi:MAG: hypothetical protein D6732_01565, partial [Methanobacteriota archaeon]
MLIYREKVAGYGKGSASPEETHRTSRSTPKGEKDIPESEYTAGDLPFLPSQIPLRRGQTKPPMIGNTKAGIGQVPRFRTKPMSPRLKCFPVPTTEPTPVLPFQLVPGLPARYGAFLDGEISRIDNSHKLNA